MTAAPIRRRTASERAAYFEGSRSSLLGLRDTLAVKMPADSPLLKFIGTCADALEAVEKATTAQEDVETVFLELGRRELVRLIEAWQSDDDRRLVTAVRDLFDGQDGELGVLLRAGVTA